MKLSVAGPMVGLVIAILLCGPGYGQEDVSKFPSKPITYIVPVTPGTGTDLSVRLIAKEAEKYLKQPIVVVNKPGAALTLGTTAIATAKPDGYTIGFSGGPPLFLTPLLEKVPFDPIKDIRSIMQYGGINYPAASCEVSEVTIPICNKPYRMTPEQAPRNVLIQLRCIRQG